MPLLATTPLATRPWLVRFDKTVVVTLPRDTTAVSADHRIQTAAAVESLRIGGADNASRSTNAGAPPGSDHLTRPGMAKRPGRTGLH